MVILNVLIAFWRFWGKFGHFKDFGMILEVLVLELEKGKTFLAPKNVFFLINKQIFQFDQGF